MKRILLYSIPLILLAIVSSCGPGTTAAPQVGGPEGTFNGTFTFYYLHEKTGVTDTTVLPNIQLQLEQSTGYKLSGDTSTVLAASYGSYVVNIPYTAISFADKTYPASGTPTKIHLAGLYSYSWDGTNLVMTSYSAFDTLAYHYVLKKIGN
jgi:hypothetical protein